MPSTSQILLCMFSFQLPEFSNKKGLLGVFQEGLLSNRVQLRRRSLGDQRGLQRLFLLGAYRLAVDSEFMIASNITLSMSDEKMELGIISLGLLFGFRADFNGEDCFSGTPNSY